MSVRRNAFSLLELLAVVLILAILAAAIVPRVTSSGTTTRTNANKHNEATINSAVERYALVNGALPDTIDDIDTVDYFPGGIPNNPLTGDPYALDPATKRVVPTGG